MRGNRGHGSSTNFGSVSGLLCVQQIGNIALAVDRDVLGIYAWPLNKAHWRGKQLCLERPIAVRKLDEMKTQSVPARVLIRKISGLWRVRVGNGPCANSSSIS